MFIGCQLNFYIILWITDEFTDSFGFALIAWKVNYTGI